MEFKLYSSGEINYQGGGGSPTPSNVKELSIPTTTPPLPTTSISTTVQATATELVYITTELTILDVTKGDLFAVGLLLYFVLTGNYPNNIEGTLNIENLDQVWKERSDFLESANTHLKTYEFANPTSLDGDILKFTVNLLNLGEIQDATFKKNYILKELLAQTIFYQEVHKAETKDEEKKDWKKKKKSFVAKDSLYCSFSLFGNHKYFNYP